MLRIALGACLTWEQREAGFYLKEDEDLLYLFDQTGKRQGMFSSNGATVKSIRDAVDEWTAKAQYE